MSEGGVGDGVLNGVNGISFRLSENLRPLTTDTIQCRKSYPVGVTEKSYNNRDAKTFFYLIILYIEENTDAYPSYVQLSSIPNSNMCTKMD